MGCVLTHPIFLAFQKGARVDAPLLLVRLVRNWRGLQTRLLIEVLLGVPSIANADPADDVVRQQPIDDVHAGHDGAEDGVTRVEVGSR